MKHKPFTIVALCLCGCQTVSLWHFTASRKQQAHARFLLDMDDDWPLEILAVKSGHLTLSETPIRKSA